MNWLIVLGGGQGTRVGKKINKVFLKINHRPIIYWTLKTAQQCLTINKIIVVVQKKYSAIIKGFGFDKISSIVEPAIGSRQDSTAKIIDLIAHQIKSNDLIGIHNAANPFVTSQEITQVFSIAKKNQSALLAVPAIDTIKITNNQKLTINSPLKNNCWGAQTPQVAQFSLLQKAFQKAQKEKFQGTDDTQLILRMGIKSKIVECSRHNFKITYPDDLEKARKIFKKLKIIE